MELWFKVLLSAFVPLLAAFLIPKEQRLFLVGASILLIMLAALLLFRQERRKRSLASRSEHE